MRTEQVKVASKAELKAFFGSVIELLVAKGFGDVLSQVMKMDLSKIGDLRGNAILVTAMLDRIRDVWSRRVAESADGRQDAGALT